MKRFRKIVPILWIVLGVLFFFYGKYGYSLLLNSDTASQKNKHDIELPQFSKRNTEEKNQAASFDASTIQPVQENAYIASQVSAEKIINQRDIGSIYIPTANIKTKILAGLTNENLILAVGTFKDTQRMGAGNYIVLAHNLVQGGGALRNINKTEIGSTIYTTDYSKIFEYKTTVNKIEDESNGILLNDPKAGERSKITLYRCEGGMNTPNRAVVQGEFVKSYDAKKGSADVLNGLGLVVEKTNASDTGKQKGQEVLLNTNKQVSKTTSDSHAIYTFYEIGAMKTFGLINDHGILIACFFMIVLLFLLLADYKPK